LDYYLKFKFQFKVLQHRFSFHKNTLIHIVLWIIIFSYYLSISWPFEPNKSFLLERIIAKVVLQIAITYCFLEVVVTSILSRKRYFLLVLTSGLLFYVGYVAFVAVRCFYLLPKYPEVYAHRPPLIFIERITDFTTFLVYIPSLLFPIAILYVIKIYDRERALAEIAEQQKNNELNLLKNQLNPHFLFNTLNNLYSFTISKSDKAALIIEKLSKILDYTLYGCKGDVVSLADELQLLQNYIAIEKIRYGNRVAITFKHNIDDKAQIAPLLLLTFVENAFKHGVSQETNLAKIDMELCSDKNEIEFKIYNTKPKTHKINDLDATKNSIGLTNIKKQLQLIYKNKHTLNIIDKEDSYYLTLKIDTNGI